jgi:DNA-binding HxlR family transcriptional regulator
MTLPSSYEGQSCSLARTLEIIGERWTLLIIRDAMLGVRRFGDFVTHLGIPRAVLTSRLKTLVAQGVLERVPGQSGHDEYALSDKGTKLLPVVRSLMAWGDEFYSPAGPRRIFSHAADGGTLDAEGRCDVCGATVDLRDTLISPGPGCESLRDDGEAPPAYTLPRRLLEPVGGGR